MLFFLLGMSWKKKIKLQDLVSLVAFKIILKGLEASTSS